MTSPCGKIRIPINEEGNEKPVADPGVPRPVPRRGHPAHRARLERPLRARSTRCARSGVKLLDTPDTYYELRRQAHPRPRRERRRAEAAQDPGRRQAGGELLLQIFTREPARADLLRVHPAQGRRRLRRGQLQGAVRVDRARPDAPRRGHEGLIARRSPEAASGSATRRSTSSNTAGSNARCTWALPATCRLSAPGKVAVDAGNTTLSQWL